MISEKLNESYYKISGTPEELQPVIRRLTVVDKNAYFDPMVQRGLKSDSVAFFEVKDRSLIVPSGLVQFLKPLGVEFFPNVLFTEQEVKEFIEQFNARLPFKMYDFQELAILESLLNPQQMCLAATGAGKSIIIAGVVEFLRLKGYKGLILVPSISLTTQLHGDFADAGLTELYDSVHLIGGDNHEKEFKKQITISTWQSAQKIQDLSPLDFILIDEGHGLKLDNKSTEIVLGSNAKVRIGLTGTLPDDEISKMAILSCVGIPKRYIRTQGLIERGLATPVHINTIQFRYGNEDKSLFKYVGNYTQKLKYVKEHVNRNLFISKLSCKIADKGNTVILCSHIEHMKSIYIEIMRQRYPDIVIENTDISGVKATEFQSKYGIYYISGTTKVKDREKIFEILKSNSKIILISNYSIMSTGINIKSLKNIVFASPLKSYTTITQSIGRAIRLHISKDVAEIYDFVDDFSVRGNSGPFYQQYLERLTKSYNSEGFPITHRIINL